MKRDVDGIVENVFEPVRPKTDERVVVKPDWTKWFKIFKSVVVDVKQKVGRKVDSFKTVKIAQSMLSDGLEPVVVDVKTTQVFGAPFEDVVLDETGISLRLGKSFWEIGELLEFFENFWI